MVPLLEGMGTWLGIGDWSPSFPMDSGRDFNSWNSTAVEEVKG
jgi:hypothetical protein